MILNIFALIGMAATAVVIFLCVWFGLLKYWERRDIEEARNRPYDPEEG